jgi:hypothetical protein
MFKNYGLIVLFSSPVCNSLELTHACADAPLAYTARVQQTKYVLSIVCKSHDSGTTATAHFDAFAGMPLPYYARRNVLRATACIPDKQA